MGGDGGDQRRLAGAPPVEVAHAHHRPRQPSGPGAVPLPPQTVGATVEELPGGGGRGGGRHAMPASFNISTGLASAPPLASSNRRARSPVARPPSGASNCRRPTGPSVADPR